MRTAAALVTLAAAADAGWISFGQHSWSAPAEWSARPTYRSYPAESATFATASAPANATLSVTSSAASRSASASASSNSVSTSASASGSATSSSASATASASVPASYLSGFKNASTGYSVGGSAICIQGDVDVPINTPNGVKLNFAIPTNQTVVTETFVEILQAGSTIGSRVNGGAATVDQTFSINVELCYPKGKALNASFVELLTHGIGFDKSYWNFFSSQYSYVDAAAQAGHATFFYDRLGVGLSAHPDAIETVQAGVEVAIAHALTQALRAGEFANTKFARVAGVGHSFGSIITVAQLNQWPTDLDAAVLTGYAQPATGLALFMAALNAAIASQNVPSKFAGLSNGYLVAGDQMANQFDFFRFPGFDPAVLAAADAAKQTVTFGELFTLGGVPSTAPAFTGPVDIVDGDNDLPFCSGNCSYPVNLVTGTQPLVFPAASAGSAYYIAEDTGHGLNLHYSAGAAYAQINAFLAANGF